MCVKGFMMERKYQFDKIPIGETIGGEVIVKKYFTDKKLNYCIYKNQYDEVGFFADKQVTNISLLLGQCNLVKDLSHGKKIKEWINKQKAIALNEFFSNNEEQSRKVLEECINTIKDRERARKKRIYIGIYFCMITLLVLARWIISWIWPEWQNIKFFDIMFFGSLGGFISLNSKLEKIEFSMEESTWNYIIVAMYKIAFACVSSIIVYFLIESDMILYTLKNSTGIAYIAAAMGGFSESLLPNFFSGVEKDIIQKKSE